MSALFASLVSLLQTDRADGKAIAEMDLLGPSSSRRPTRTSANTHSSFVRGPRIFILQKISEALLRESSESRRFESTRSAAASCAFRESLRFVLQTLGDNARVLALPSGPRLAAPATPRPASCPALRRTVARARPLHHRQQKLTQNCKSGGDFRCICRASPLHERVPLRCLLPVLGERK